MYTYIYIYELVKFVLELLVSYPGVQKRLTFLINPTQVPFEAAYIYIYMGRGSYAPSGAPSEGRAAMLGKCLVTVFSSIPIPTKIPLYRSQ